MAECKMESIDQSIGVIVMTLQARGGRQIFELVTNVVAAIFETARAYRGQSSALAPLAAQKAPNG
jgi:hypothetical protein